MADNLLAAAEKQWETHLRTQAMMNKSRSRRQVTTVTRSQVAPVAPVTSVVVRTESVPEVQETKCDSKSEDNEKCDNNEPEHTEETDKPAVEEPKVETRQSRSRHPSGETFLYLMYRTT